MWCSRYGIRPENVIIYGQSIGTVPSVDLASRYESAAVILHSPLTSGMRVAFPDTKKTYCFDAFPKWVSFSLFLFTLDLPAFNFSSCLPRQFSPKLCSISYQLDTYCLLLWAAMLCRRRLVGWFIRFLPHSCCCYCVPSSDKYFPTSSSVFILYMHYHKINNCIQQCTLDWSNQMQQRHLYFNKK